jgi:hypothetical protein
MTVNLAEHQVGFDTNKIGFPSIYGCMAMVVVLPGGLYGYHLAGGETKDAWDKRGPQFKKFITDAGGDPAKATRLYGIAHVTNQRGWGMGNKRELWLAELKAYAVHLGTDCRISGFNLDDAIGMKIHTKDKPAYVEFRNAGARCSAWMETWKDSMGTVKTTNPWGNDVMTIKRDGGGTVSLTAATGDFYDPITPTAALKQVHKTKLQG